MRFAHIINPVNVPQDRLLYRGQKMGYASILEAKKAAAPQVQVDLYAVCYPEDVPMVPEGFTLLPFLKRSVLDIHTFVIPRKLPLVGDIIQSLYDNTDAEYLLWSDSEIIYSPDFYTMLAGFIENGMDGFACTRRTVPDTFSSPADLPKIHAMEGLSRIAGFDVFLFRRDIVPKMDLGTVCVGMPRIEWSILTNLVALSKKADIRTDLTCTKHMGDPTGWSDRRFEDYWRHNHAELQRIWKKFGKAVMESGNPKANLIDSKVQRVPLFFPKEGLGRKLYRLLPPFIRHGRLPKVLRQLLGQK